MSSLASMRN